MNDYTSPIEMITNSIIKSDEEQLDDYLLFSVEREIGFKVDKEELIKALEYDRKQYEKGFEDGLRSAKEWIPLNDRLCLPEKNGEYLVTVRGTTNRYYITLCDFALNLYEVDKYDFDNRRGIAGFYKYDSEYGYYEVLNAVAWMPLPEPYKQEVGE